MCSGFATRSANSIAAGLIAVGVAIAAVSPAGASDTASAPDTRRAGVRLVVQSSPLAGFRYYAAAEVWHELRVGDPLELVREPENRFDERAVGIAWRGRKLGYLPRRENAALAWALDRGELVRARVSRLAMHPNPARRIKVEVYVE